MSAATKYHAFLGLCPPTGLIPQWRYLRNTAPKLKEQEIRWQPWYKLHLTLHFWPKVSRADFFELLGYWRQWSLKNAKPQSHICGVALFNSHLVLYLRETSPEISELHRLVQQFVLAVLPTHLQGELRDQFIPHWTIARKFPLKPRSKQLRRWLNSLQQFELVGTSPALELYFSANGIYEAHSLQIIS